MSEVSAELFTDIVTQNNFIYNCLKKLFDNIKDIEGLEPRLVGKADRFQNFLTSKFGWIFDEEDDEDKPVIVDLNEEK